jgi:hypothetical protein
MQSPPTRRRGRDLNPRGGLTPPTRLAGERLRPLGHLSKIGLSRYLSGGGGIRTHETRNGPNGFQDRRLRPLGHPSTGNVQWYDDRPPTTRPVQVQAPPVCAQWRRGWDSNPRGGVSPLRHFECRALDRTMRPLRSDAQKKGAAVLRYRLHVLRSVEHTTYRGFGLGRPWRRERDLNPRGGANPQRHFQCRALGQTMRSLPENLSDLTGRRKDNADL